MRKRAGRRVMAINGIGPPFRILPTFPVNSQLAGQAFPQTPPRRSARQMRGLYAASDDGGDMTSVALRTANDIITRAMPLKIRLTPTRVPMAHAELDGHCM